MQARDPSASFPHPFCPLLFLIHSRFPNAGHSTQLIDWLPWIPSRFNRAPPQKRVCRCQLSILLLFSPRISIMKDNQFTSGWGRFLEYTFLPVCCSYLPKQKCRSDAGFLLSNSRTTISKHLALCVQLLIPNRSQHLAPTWRCPPNRAAQSIPCKLKVQLSSVDSIHGRKVRCLSTFFKILFELGLGLGLWPLLYCPMSSFICCINYLHMLFTTSLVNKY